MKDYIKFYKYAVDYEAAKPNLPDPHAVYCWETNIVDISNPIWNEKQYFALKAVDGDATLTITNNGGAAPQLWYSYDQENWTDWTAAGYPEVTIYDGKKIYLKGENDQFGYSSSKYSAFGGTGKYEASGSISSLLDGDDIYGNLERECKNYMFYYLFRNNSSLIKWEVDIPYRWTSTGNYCFYSCFQSCSSITTIDFTIPDSVTSLGGNCFTYCFSGLSSITTIDFTIPDSVTSLGGNCFSSCFQNCKSLTTATLVIPASVTSLGNYCFYYTFSSCTKLTNLVIEHHPPRSTSSGCYSDWLYYVPNQTSNIFRIYQADEAAWPRSNSGIPSNFTIEYLG